ncbi:hypothetical protein QVD17_41370 [Tagetes erecta]|uniref:Uncharacterized protein n=1 Tax=Tagetes erecta TaxID=13708 RepID=A0AAD8JKB9_TARER|nr:hypothetical protein QVD17_41370 [Tagetes erecta]
MQRLARRQCYDRRFFIDKFQRITKTFSTTSSSVISDQLLINDADSFVLVEGSASSRTVVLNRPSVLNALNTPLKAYSFLEQPWHFGTNHVSAQSR